MTARMSRFVTRPPTPDPDNRDRSMPCSRAIRRTNGDDRWRRGVSRSTSSLWESAGGDAGVGRADATSSSTAACMRLAGGVAAGVGGAAVSPAWPMTATTVWIGTVSPTLALISVSTPAAGDGISASTLSVEISNSGSSRSTASPTRLIQRTMVPSAMDSPICGITTSVDMDRHLTRTPITARYLLIADSSS